MLIGELARRSGLTKDTVRFYERAGLIAAGEKEAGSRTYKTFDEEALERLVFIKNGQAGGWTLRDIKEVLDKWGMDIDAIPQHELIPVLEAKLATTDEKLRRLQQVREYLANKLERARAGQTMAGLKFPE
jgi:MerR family Zn(II)-responsive transcriptional regulator of zntA